MSAIKLPVRQGIFLHTRWIYDADGTPICRCETASYVHQIVQALNAETPTPNKTLLKAAENMDWMQVRLHNGGAPCFHLETDGAFCGRADRWQGHFEKGFHKFVSLADLLKHNS